jgi:hypothetical protein
LLKIRQSLASSRNNNPPTPKKVAKSPEGFEIHGQLEEFKREGDDI